MDIEGLQVRAVSLFEDPTKKEYNTLSILVYVEIDAIEDMTKKYEICSCFDKDLSFHIWLRLGVRALCQLQCSV